MRERVSTEVAIIGGGIVGASAALFLRQMDIPVVLVERDLCGSRSSGVNYGGVRRQGRTTSELPLSQRAHAIWGRLRELIGIDGEYVRSGHLKIARSQADLASLEAYRERTKDFGMDLQILSLRALRERCPWLGKDVVGGSLCPEDGHANPRLVSPAFALAARRSGADVREQTRIDEAAHDGSGFVLRSGNALEIRARYLLNCAGAWAGSIAAQFGEVVPMQSAYPAMAVTEPLPVFMDLSLGTQGEGIYARQVARGNCVIGRGRGYALDGLRTRVDKNALECLIRGAADVLPALRNAHIIRTWSGTEGYLSDDQPVIGASQTTAGLFHAFGFAGQGFQSGPAAGAVLAELVCAGQTATPIDAFSASRFSPGPQPATAGLSCQPLPTSTAFRPGVEPANYLPGE